MICMGQSKLCFQQTPIVPFQETRLCSTVSGLPCRRFLPSTQSGGNLSRSHDPALFVFTASRVPASVLRGSGSSAVRFLSNEPVLRKSYKYHLQRWFTVLLCLCWYQLCSAWRAKTTQADIIARQRTWVVTKWRTVVSSHSVDLITAQSSWQARHPWSGPAPGTATSLPSTSTQTSSQSNSSGRIVQTCVNRSIPSVSTSK